MKNHAIFSSKRGFTLPEVLATIIIVGILSAIAVPSWLSFVQERQLNIAQNQVYRTIREAQNQAKKEKLPWQASFRKANNVVQWAVHPSTVPPNNASWNNFNERIQIDPETTALSSTGLWQAKFDYQGNAALPLKRITLSDKNGGTSKRCVYISTILGAIRTAKERSTPNDEGKYCY